MSAIRDAAIAYATTNNWAIFPAPRGTKKSYKSARHSGGAKWGMSRDVTAIRADWERWPDANVGIPTGAVNKFFVVEADTIAGGHTADGIASMRALEAEHGALPPTRMAMSPSGSTHWYFRHPGPGVKIMNSASTLAPGVDVRGDGGMVIAPPSVRNDGEYVWLNDLEIAEAPAWLIERATARPRSNGRANGGDHDDVVTVDYDAIAAALDVIPNNDIGWEDWNRIAMIVFVATAGTSRGLDLFDEWSQKSSKYDAGKTVERWEKLRTSPPTNLTVASLYYLADQAYPRWRHITIDDFYAYMAQHAYIFAATGDLWPAPSIDARLPPVVVTDENGEAKRVKPHSWLDRHRPVEQMTWVPGEPEIIRDRLVSDGGFFPRRGARVYNIYRRWNCPVGDATRAGPWLDLIDKIFGEERHHALSWLAHRVQRPSDKINHALVIGGGQGIGKDTLLMPIRSIVGPNNFKDVSPQHIISPNNDYVKSVILRINEGRDLGDADRGRFDRFKFYEHMKVVITAPPEVFRVNEKHLRQYYVVNVTGVIITTNHKQDGLFLPKDDRRHHVTWCELTADDFPETYWQELYAWYADGGIEYVNGYLASYPIADFDPKAPPPKTQAFWAIVDANKGTEGMEIEDAIDRLNSGLERSQSVAGAFIVDELIGRTEFSGRLDAWLEDPKNARLIPHKLEECGYVLFPNNDRADRLWMMNGRRVRMYVLSTLSHREKMDAAWACQHRVERPS
ncbi:MAG TPA: bifunctional DNA primase/polymerase [Polyangia bacterium]|nr:bifunctional DNA primase/polymerase [Polyangia bacterium]